MVFNTSGILHPQLVFLPVSDQDFCPGRAALPALVSQCPDLPIIVYPTCERPPTTKSSLFSIGYRCLARSVRCTALSALRLIAFKRASGFRRPVFAPSLFCCWLLNQAITATVSN